MERDHQEFFCILRAQREEIKLQMASAARRTILHFARVARRKILHFARAAGKKICILRTQREEKDKLCTLCA
jgi:hypothetical protein